MNPDDPRHGTYAGAVQHWFDKKKPCGPCAQAEWRYRKTRQLRHLSGDTPNVPSLGTIRRYQALMALGWTGPQIAAASGISINSLRSISYHGSTVVRRETEAAISAAYDKMCMTRPEGHYANRTRATALRRGWVPPLAWDDIDDPDEQPTDWEYKPSDRRESFLELDAAHVGISEACARLDVTKDALEKWSTRHGLADVFNRMSAREDGLREWRNQYTSGRVA